MNSNKKEPHEEALKLMIGKSILTVTKQSAEIVANKIEVNLGEELEYKSRHSLFLTPNYTQR